jgi:hypothetical protein
MKLLIAMYRSFQGEGSASMCAMLQDDPPDVTQLESWEGAFLVREASNLRLEPTCRMASLMKVPLDVPAAMTLPDMHSLLAREANHPSMIQWEQRGVSEMVDPPWEELELGQLRRLMFRMPLNPKPAMATFGAPQHTRLALVYYLPRLQEDDEAVRIAVRSRPLDVPYGTSFYITTLYTFTKVDGCMMGEACMGVTWTGRCLVRAIVETASKDEAIELSKEFFKIIGNLSMPEVA